MKHKDITHSIAVLYKSHRKSLPASFEWEDEQERWHELVFCLLIEITGLEYFKAREITNKLVKGELVDLDALSNLCNKSSSQKEKYKKSVQKIFGANISTEVSDAFIDSLIDLAASIKKKYDKPQILLRMYGEGMVKELVKSYRSNKLNGNVKRKVFIHWLNNVLEMPLLYSDKPVESFCKENSCSKKELMNAADNLDINLSVIDDLIYYNSLKSKK